MDSRLLPFAFRRRLRASFGPVAVRLFGKKSGELTGPEMALVFDNTFSMMEKLRPELDEFTKKRMFRQIF